MNGTDKITVDLIQFFLSLSLSLSHLFFIFFSHYDDRVNDSHWTRNVNYFKRMSLYGIQCESDFLLLLLQIHFSCIDEHIKLYMTEQN